MIENLIKILCLLLPPNLFVILRELFVLALSKKN